uniref:Uncharacterized protein n=1 Tax=Hyaloperonospora arabidopsidis (strain Emoy2) TaxID=559515 RepID=M4BK23_HYAAE
MALLLGRTYSSRLHYNYFCRLLKILEPASIDCAQYYSMLSLSLSMAPPQQTALEPRDVNKRIVCSALLFRLCGFSLTEIEGGRGTKALTRHVTFSIGIPAYAIIDTFPLIRQVKAAPFRIGDTPGSPQTFQYSSPKL